MNTLLSAGVIFFAYAVGRWALAGCLAPGLRRSALARHTLALVLGIAILTPPLVALAGAGLFRVRMLGAVCWIGGAITLIRRPPHLARRSSIDLPDAFALLAVIVFASVAANARDETLGGGRDQQIYAESAVALSERGEASGRYTQLDEADRSSLAYREEHAAFAEKHLARATLPPGLRRELRRYHTRESASVAAVHWRADRRDKVHEWARRGRAQNALWPLWFAKRLAGQALGR